MTLVDSAPLLEVSRQVAIEVAAIHADEVDRDSRFPSEAIEALAAGGVLAAMVPKRAGGDGMALSTVGESVALLAASCSSTGMVAAMHHLQVACLARHGRTRDLDALLERVAGERLLLASATTETGIGGQLRSSSCALSRRDGRYRLEKSTPTLSYGLRADAVLATARRNDDAPPSDQVLVACLQPDLHLEQVAPWDALGMRGTESGGFCLRAEGTDGLVFPDSFAEIAEQTMLPVSHVLWSFVWLGMADAAVDAARRFVQQQARRTPGERPPNALGLAELSASHLVMGQLVRSVASICEAKLSCGELLGYSDFVALNSLKISASQMVVEIVTAALRLCGMAGYSNRSPFSLGRLLRDAHSGALMVSNDRLLFDNANMLAVTKGTSSWAR